METLNIETSLDPDDAIRLLRRALSRIYHDTNNPLSIVSGNAQYFLELAKSMDVDDELIQPVEDIEEASERIADGLRQLNVLRDEIDVYLRGRRDGT
jgi:signal transduction histidine kinase